MIYNLEKVAKEFGIKDCSSKNKGVEKDLDKLLTDQFIEETLLSTVGLGLITSC